MRSDRERLQDILEAIAQIERYASQGQERFNQEELIQVWMVITCKSLVKPPVHYLRSL